MCRAFITAILFSIAPVVAIAAPPQSCASDAIARAKPLLAFHFGEDSNVSIAESAKELPSIQNPANKKQRLRVFEVWGYIYKGEYRMRFLYFHSPQTGCVLMGQEILEHAKL